MNNTIETRRQLLEPHIGKVVTLYTNQERTTQQVRLLDVGRTYILFEDTKDGSQGGEKIGNLNKIEFTTAIKFEGVIR